MKETAPYSSQNLIINNFQKENAGPSTEPAFKKGKRPLSFAHFGRFSKWLERWS